LEIFDGHRALLRPLQSPAVTIGNFDGVHLGHRALIRRAVEAAEKRSGDSCVLTFEPHPTAFFRPDKAPPRLSPLQRKLELLSETGVGVAVIESFDAELSKRSAEQFIDEILVATLGVSHVVIGHDFRFGKGRSGDADTLRAAGERHGFTVDVVAAVEVGGEVASSSAIRTALSEGRLGDANRLLGRPYDVDGTVQPGASRGRELGFPTANLMTEGQLIPAPGIYATWVELPEESRRYMGATSLGSNPTFVSEGVITLETFLLDYSGDLYGKTMRVSFIERIRDHEKFDSTESLVAQIRSDVEQCREVLGAPGRSNRQ